MLLLDAWKNLHVLAGLHGLPRSHTTCQATVCPGLRSAPNPHAVPLPAPLAGEHLESGPGTGGSKPPKEDTLACSSDGAHIQTKSC